MVLAVSVATVLSFVLVLQVVVSAMESLFAVLQKYVRVLWPKTSTDSCSSMDWYHLTVLDKKIHSINARFTVSKTIQTDQSCYAQVPLVDTFESWPIN